MPSNTKPKKRVVRLKKRRSFWSRTSTASRLAIGFLILCQFCLSYMCFQLYTQIATLRQSQLQMQRAPSCDTVTTNISPLLSKLTDDYDLGRVLIHEVTTYTNKSHIPKFYVACYKPPEWLCNRIYTHGQYESDILEYAFLGDLKKFSKKDALFVDVGANIGLWTLFAASKGFRTLSFEANAMTFRRLSANCVLNNLQHVTDLRFNAIDEVEGRTVFSMIAPNNMGANRILNESRYGEVAVRTVRLGDIEALRRHCERNLPLVLKMDIEGFETKAFRGGEWLWQSGCVRAYYVEMLPTYHSREEVLGISMLLKSYKYEPKSIYNDQRWVLSPHERSAVERDQFYTIATMLLCALKDWQTSTSHCASAPKPLSIDAVLRLAANYTREKQRYDAFYPVDSGARSFDAHQALLNATHWISLADQSNFTLKFKPP